MADQWHPIATAPKDLDILVWYDHDADPYLDPDGSNNLTPYAAWAEGGEYLAGKGVCIAKYLGSFWESTDEYGSGYYLPAAWFALENGDYERVVNPTHWMLLPEPPKEANHDD